MQRFIACIRRSLSIKIEGTISVKRLFNSQRYALLILVIKINNTFKGFSMAYDGTNVPFIACRDVLLSLGKNGLICLYRFGYFDDVKLTDF